MRNFVCITSAEWRNLCSTGRIRLLESRTVSFKGEPDQKSISALFFIAPDRFAPGETSDFLIVEYQRLRLQVNGIVSDQYACGVRWMLLEDAIQFFPVRAEDTWAFETDAQKAQVRLGPAMFEKHWQDWFQQLACQQACLTGLTLIHAFGLDGTVDEADLNPASWTALAQQMISPHAVEFPSSLFRKSHALFELIREDSGTGAIFVSCAIEWLNLCLDTDILEADAELAQQAQSLHAKYLQIPFSPALALEEELVQFDCAIRNKAPDLFPDPWQPSLISLYVRFDHTIRFGSIRPEEIIDCVRTIIMIAGSGPARLMAFLLGVALGPNKTHSLERILCAEKFLSTAATPDAPAGSV